jgi:signal transduction histidine kinase
MLDEPSLILSGTWYARPDGSDRLLGVSVSVADSLSAIEEQMRVRALLDPQDALVRPPLAAEPVGLSNLPIDVASPRFAAAIADGDRRFWVKTGFVALSAVLALVIAFLAAVVQSRKQRFVELKSDFVATVSHELRTPLASIRLMAETLERRTAGIRAARDYPTRIVGEIDELTFLVDNILSFNRLDKGRWKPRREHVALRALIDDVTSELPAVSGEPVEVTVTGLDHVMLAADRELLRLLLRNLTKNACVYNERSPVRIDVRGNREGSMWVLEVSDNGSGIEPSQTKRIFSDFYRAGPAQTRGSGLGLAICRKTMQAHGGRIRVAYSSDEGTTFALSFPANIVEDS